jgi:urate oxidase
MKVGSGKSEAGSRKKTATWVRAAGSRAAAGAAPANGIVLGENNYGKSRVRVMKVSRKGKTHTVREFDVAVALTGDFAPIHTHGDNTNCLPTDTMKNTMHALGKGHPIAAIEDFAIDLCRHFLKTHAPASSVTVRIDEIAWKRVHVRGKPHPHCFLRGSEERRTCNVYMDRDGITVSSGIEGMVILKSTDSAFAGYPKDRFTTLPETRDRIFCTSVTAVWEFEAAGRPRKDYGAWRALARETLIETFAAHKSESVQHTLYAMGEQVLRACKPIASIRLSMPNKHCLLVNLKPFGMTNPNEIFMPTDEPHGLIEATIRRE